MICIFLSNAWCIVARVFKLYLETLNSFLSANMVSKLKRILAVASNGMYLDPLLCCSLVDVTNASSASDVYSYKD